MNYSLKHLLWISLISIVVVLGLMSTDVSAKEPFVWPELNFSEKLVDEPSGIEYYLLEGAFTENSGVTIAKFLEEHPEPVTILLNSNGGYANDLPFIMDVVRVHGEVTFYSNVCMSACATMAAAGKEAYGRYHFHGVYRDNPDVPGGKVLSVGLNMEIIRKLVIYGWNEYVAKQAMSAKYEWLLVNVPPPTKDNDFKVWTLAAPQFMDLFTDNEVLRMISQGHPTQ